MEIRDYVQKIRLGEVQKYENVAMIPLFMEIEKVPNFITLEEALKTQKFFIKEVSKSGMVPNLKVVNKLDVPVFIMDGEELKGGRQNRVLNTSILVQKNSEVIIPVSCTEQGRWHYSSETFEEPDYVIPSDIRKHKNEAVFNSLINEGNFESDQGKIWDEIYKYHEKHAVHSNTGALRDVLDKQKGTLEEKIQSFHYIKEQKGIMVFVNGKVDGLDVISLSSAYELLHNKLVESYILRAHSEKGKFKEDYIDKAISFLKEIENAEVLKFKSVSLGWDFRFKGENLVGSVLAYMNKPIHINFFRGYN
ncbi:MAG TPA: hypothetical protein PKW19_06585 [Dictyoglomaceae bacterium]|nr:hypothetical protein [Dictyoglomaceae bacterium]